MFINLAPESAEPVHYAPEPEPGDTNVTADPDKVTCETCARKLGTPSPPLAPLCVAEFLDPRDVRARKLGKPGAGASEFLGPFRECASAPDFSGLPAVLAPIYARSGPAPRFADLPVSPEQFCQARRELDRPPIVDQPPLVTAIFRPKCTKG